MTVDHTDSRSLAQPQKDGNRRLRAFREKTGVEHPVVCRPAGSWESRKCACDPRKPVVSQRRRGFSRHHTPLSTLPPPFCFWFSGVGRHFSPTRTSAPTSVPAAAPQFPRPLRMEHPRGRGARVPSSSPGPLQPGRSHSENKDQRIVTMLPSPPVGGCLLGRTDERKQQDCCPSAPPNPATGTTSRSGRR